VVSTPLPSGGKRCAVDGCMAGDRGGGKCIAHGGGKRCQTGECNAGAAGGGTHCVSHGGGLQWWGAASSRIQC
jgi:hypothetical protein